MQLGVVCPAVPTARLGRQGTTSYQQVLASSKAACVRQPLRFGSARCPRPPSRSCGLIVHAAAASAGGDDPYQVLGLSRTADSNAVNRAYKKKLADARGNDAEKAKIESAHSIIMMSQLSARLKGGVEVAKEVRFADKAVYFPWRPRRHNADKKIMLYTGLAYAVMAAWGVLTQSTAGTQPLVASTVIGAASNIYKLQQIFPSGPSESGGASGLKNLLRGAMLAIAATFLGCFLIFTLPDWTAAQINKQLPYWVYENESALLTVGTAISNWIMSSFFR